MKLMYSTDLGSAHHGNSHDLLSTDLGRNLVGKVDLIFTSPPFPLLRKKRYGNVQGEEYVEWLASFGPLFRDLLTDSGSLVVEVGNTWEAGQPTMSTLPLRALLALQESAGFYLCQQLVWHNPARLPSPAQWVNIERIRLKDAHTHVWWLGKAPKPKADNRRVLTAYSKPMERLLESGRYNAGRRPSEHNISEAGFTTDNAGAIAGSVLTYSNTGSLREYHTYCKQIGVRPHPARMPQTLAEFFIRFLTTSEDLILDPFAGSNTTGAAAEMLGRRWVAIEREAEYLQGSIGRFQIDQKTA